eukprot:COSAG02_NODE_3812_length_6193_cov_4.258123_5_plen_89_part_00
MADLVLNMDWSGKNIARASVAKKGWEGGYSASTAHYAQIDHPFPNAIKSLAPPSSSSHSFADNFSSRLQAPGSRHVHSFIVQHGQGPL